jgi:YidC/Oxa1 family membrane protein insertase
LIDDGLAKAGVPYSYGFAIILITIAVKLATYPLSKKQVESTLSMQSLQPRIKDLQAKFANDPERLQVETAKMYQTAGVNPLAGCLPTLATIPVFIGLYRALSNVADEGLLTEGFFWIPSLAGPTKLNGGLGWLSLTDGGAPPLGWHDTISYLILPVLLVISQFLSQKIISPQQQSTDPAQQQTQNILKFIPLMIGWFSLNVPSGLTLYWFTNNIITTAQQVYLRKKFQPAEFPIGGGGGTIVKPKEPERPRGPTGKDLNARRSNKSSAVIDVEAETVSGSSFPAAPFGGASSSSSSSSGQSQGEKFRAIKAREAARKAAEQAGVASSASTDGNGAAAEAASAAASAAPVATAVDNQASKPEVPSAAPSKDGGFAKSNGSRGKSSGGGKKGSKRK